MNMLRLWICVAGILGLAQAARAQVPFFYPGATAFTPEISIVETGALSDVQATVSADQKYVTLTMRPQNTTLLSLRSFTFQQGTNFGNVGDPLAQAGANPGPAGRSEGHDDPASAVRTSPSDILAHAKSQTSILHRPGMTRVGSVP
jgi:hypothetical protein